MDQITLIRNELVDVHRRVNEQCTTVLQARDELRAGVAALDNDQARRRLTESYRAERRDELRAKVQAVVGPAGQALALASAVKASRDAWLGTDAMLRGARLVELLPLDQDADGNRHRAQTNELRLLRDELMRARLRSELEEADAEELTAVIQSAAATGNRGLLGIARQALRKRAASATGVEAQALVPAQSALVSALEAIEPPADVADLARLCAEIDRMAWRLSEALHEIETGQAPAAPGESVERVAELAAEHGATEGAMKFAQEREAVRQRQQAAAKIGAQGEVERAIRLDDTDATNPAA